MDGEAVQRIKDLAEAGVEVQKVGGAAFSAVRLDQVEPTFPEPDPIEAHSLDGLVDYLTENQDELEAGKAAVHVVGPEEVRVVGSLTEISNQRFVYARATYDASVGRDRPGEVGLDFGTFYPTEDANIALQALFEDGADRSEVLALLGNVVNQEEIAQKDDGVSQRVAAKSGIGIEKEDVPNPVDLAPRRTFPEVEQPVSPFVLRLRKNDQRGITAALFEADGGAWRLEAIDRIAAYLEDKVEFPIFS